MGRRERRWGNLVAPMRLMALGYIVGCAVRFAMHRTWGWWFALLAALVLGLPWFRPERREGAERPRPRVWEYLWHEPRTTLGFAVLPVVVVVEARWPVFWTVMAVTPFMLLLFLVFPPSDD